MPSKKTRTHVPALFDSCGQKEIIIDVRDHPTPTDLRKNMNSDLVDMFLKTCNPMRKILLGVDKPLQGPNMAQMWIDPADRLKGKVQFTPPKDILCLKALTHESILNIGKSFEDKLQQTQEQLILKAVKDAKENAKYYCVY